ncbi:hypothetical protein AVL48_07300 [Amycolatopsis regifaucium]|uniref:Uncharacterized protein n=1 Tax=Amycolatopsis regifaucium TaxID=546365 RepID=A0A154MB44_9PSEU|nr:hypothetical protein AVL48_07300 [Amycolatopsis regifaucium]OKA06160.1 hypothetical protein ATP06_0223705 [Amycolatopsis regifaucium]
MGPVTTLDDLEPPWGDPPPDATGLMTTVYRLRRKPIRDFEVEDLRVLLGQQVSVEVLVPLALPLLEADPMAEGRYYPGDLLAAILMVREPYWRKHPDHLARLREVIRMARETGDVKPLRRQLEAFPQES